MHGTAVYLPNKINYLNRKSMQLKADIVAFAYRGFSLSDGQEPTETGIMTDCNAINDYFSNYIA